MTTPRDGFVVIINPRPDGKWDVDLWERRGEHKFKPRDIEEIYGVSASAIVRTEAKARRLASKMLARVRTADAAMYRDRYEVTE